MDKDSLHLVQKDILGALKFKEDARFSDLNLHDLTNDHFTFHIRKLVTKGLIQKTERGTYELTVMGKELVSHFDFKNDEPEQRHKMIAIPVIKAFIEDQEKFLIHKRARQPFYGYCGLPSIKIPRGKNFEAFIKSKLEEYTGLVCEITFLSVEHKIDYSNEGQPLEDSIFFVYQCKPVGGNILAKTDEGENMWMTREEIQGLKNVFENDSVIFNLLNNKQLLFIEKSYTVDTF